MFLARTIPGALVLCALFADGVPAEEPQERRPNVLFVMADDLNDWVGCMRGHPNAWTPNLDRLARRGTLFSNAHCASPVCNPSRVSILTGVHASRSGIYRNKHEMREWIGELVTLPQHFRNQGYFVMGGGKIFHGHLPDPASWDESFPGQGKYLQLDPRPPGRRQGISAGLDWGAVEVPEGSMQDEEVAAWAVEQLKREYDRPFFLAVGFLRPHLPWYAPQEHFAAFASIPVALPVVREDDIDDIHFPMGDSRRSSLLLHDAVVRQGKWQQAVTAYLACIRFMDAQLGRVLEALDQGPHAADTIVVFVSDHGMHLGEKHHWRKRSLWEESTRVPLILAAPGFEGAQESARSVSLVDLFPTLAELCGLPLDVPQGLDGSSLVPLLRDCAADWNKPAITSLDAESHAVRTDRWRYIRYGDGSEELYDHAADPSEWINLADEEEQAEIKRSLRRLLPGG